MGPINNKELWSTFVPSFIRLQQVISWFSLDKLISTNLHEVWRINESNRGNGLDSFGLHSYDPRMPPSCTQVKASNVYITRPWGRSFTHFVKPIEDCPTISKRHAGRNWRYRILIFRDLFSFFSRSQFVVIWCNLTVKSRCWSCTAPWFYASSTQFYIIYFYRKVVVVFIRQQPVC